MLDLEVINKCVEHALDTLIRAYFTIKTHLALQEQHTEKLEFSDHFQGNLRDLQHALETLLKAIQDVGGGERKEFRVAVPETRRIHESVCWHVELQAEAPQPVGEDPHTTQTISSESKASMEDRPRSLLDAPYNSRNSTHLP